MFQEFFLCFIILTLFLSVNKWYVQIMYIEVTSPQNRLFAEIITATIKGKTSQLYLED